MPELRSSFRNPTPHGLSGRAGRRDPSSSVAPVSSGYERGVGGTTSSREPPAPASVALAHRTRSAPDHSAMTSKIRIRMQELDKIWMNGELVDWADARIHVASHGLHYGTGVFEGIRCYETA